MNSIHPENEQVFYDEAFSDNKTRVQRGFAWPYEPSQTVIEILTDTQSLRNAQGKRALDLGCGDGRHSKFLAQSDFQVTGVDFSDAAIDFCRRRSQREGWDGNFERIDLTEKGALSNLGQFNLIMDWSVMNHIRRCYLQRYIRNIKNALREGGRLLLTEFASIPGLFNGKDYTTNYKDFKGHYSRIFTFDELDNLFRLAILAFNGEHHESPENEMNIFNTVLFQK